MNEKSAYTQVHLLFCEADGSQWRYACADHTVSWAASDWIGLPQARVEMASQTGGSKDEPLKLTLPDVAPFTAAASGAPSPPIIVTLWELLLNPDGTGDIQILWKGVCSRVQANRSGRMGLLTVTVAGRRNSLNAAMGVISGNTCAHSFGDLLCTKDVESLKQTMTITAIIRNRVWLSGADFTPIPKLFRGYLQIGQMRVLIRNHIFADATISVVDLAQVPPASWVGLSVRIAPGCAKDFAACQGWSNETNFGGYGIAIPAYNPIIETH